jgi:hypothetical protein
MVSYRKNRDRQPKLTHHKASGQGVVRLNGKDVYCCRYGTPECRAKYLRSLSEWEAADRQPIEPPAVTKAIRRHSIGRPVSETQRCEHRCEKHPVYVLDLIAANRSHDSSITSPDESERHPSLETEETTS